MCPTRCVLVLALGTASCVARADDVAVRSALEAAVEADWESRDAAQPAPRYAVERTLEVIGRARRLAERLSSATRPSELTSNLLALEQVESRLADIQKDDLPSRRGLYIESCRVARRIAFSNPLLTIERLLFVKRHDAAGVFHMCDQFYGCNAVPGGGLFVLHDPCGDQPRLEDLLSGVPVEKGRLSGRSLDGGSFLAPEVSFDGTTILFAHTEATAHARSGGKETYLWGPSISYHLFRVQADGTALTQLTDGEADDFDPCFLPDGRIVFVSTRRGGFLRCGRHCPVYTLFDMNPDGTGIRPLSHHETHEWQPSVANDGRIVYTRWDYVDRDTNIAHHPWTCLPDGRDPREFHGNYPVRRESRPWMELDLRAIPGSSRFVATAGAHHGHAFGSLVLIDPRPIDDGAMSQITRLTPEIPFPEAEGRPIERYMVYGTPWPLGEHDFLCAYDPAARNHGLYWIDTAGNRELIYRDPAIACVSPMPLAPRPRPPVLATIDDDPSETKARVVVANVYESESEWPAGTEVASLRVVQVLPKSTPAPNEPRIGVAEQTNARAVLGTVPVEPDGSAYFEVPSGKPLYFQVLDDRGMAIQSMRSVTYAKPGQTMSCVGCHESKHRAPCVGSAMPLALKRPPSLLAPEPDGSNPFSYVRLVQPVLDRACVPCHREKRALDLAGQLDGPNGWSRSYVSLARPFGFYFDVANGSISSRLHGGARTLPGQFGASAAPLARYLGPEHHGVRLSSRELRRLTLWLDCNSEFYGSYERTSEQGAGQVVAPSLQ